MHPLPLYEGPLDRKKMTRVALAAYNCYMNQRRRCYTKTNPRYKDNGAKGIKVEYGVREFIQWYLDNINKFRGSRPSVGRIDHAKNYSFDNIQIESLADNSMERIRRVGPTKPRRPVWAIHESGKVTLCESCLAAAKFTGIRVEHVQAYCRGKVKKSRKGYRLRYVDQLYQAFRIQV